MISNRGKWKPFINIIKWIYTPLAFVFIAFLIYKNFNQISGIYHNATLKFFCYSVLYWTSLQLISPIGALLIFRSFGYALPYRDILKINISRLPARYLPGGIWQTVGRMVDYYSYGVSKYHLSFLAIFETFFPIPTSIFLGGFLLTLTSSRSLPDYFSYFSILPCAVILVIPFFTFLFSSIKRFPLLSQPGTYLALLTSSLLFWILASGAFFFYYKSVSANLHITRSFLQLAGAYIYSWGVGYISIFAPQGLGVFEVVAAKLVSLPLTFGSSIAFFAGFRLIALSADLLVYTLYKLLAHCTYLSDNSKNNKNHKNNNHQHAAKHKQRKD